MLPTNLAITSIASRLTKLTCYTVSYRQNQFFSTTPCLSELIKLTRVRVIDNSAIGKAAVAAGKPGKIIHVYKKSGVGRIGDKVLIAIGGEKKKGYITGCRQKQKTHIPRFDTNNVVLVEESGTPIGTRIKAPIPSILRKKEGEFTKILSIATKFV